MARPIKKDIYALIESKDEEIAKCEETLAKLKNELQELHNQRIELEKQQLYDKLVSKGLSFTQMMQMLDK